MSRLLYLLSLLSFASIGIAQVPNIVPFTVTGGLEG
jgi:hypothetical protein